MLFGKKTQEFPAAVLTHDNEPRDTTEVNRERVCNLIEISRLMDDAPVLGQFALQNAKKLSDENHFDFDELSAEVSYTQYGDSIAS